MLPSTIIANINLLYLCEDVLPPYPRVLAWCPAGGGRDSAMAAFPRPASARAADTSISGDSSTIFTPSPHFNTRKYLY